MDENRKIMSQSLAVTIGVAVLAGALFGGYLLLHKGSEPPPNLPPPAIAAPAPAPAPAEAGPRNPIDESGSDHTTTLDHSDDAVLDALKNLAGWKSAMLQLILPENIIRHVVATVDALPREKLPLNAIPTKPVEGLFRTAAKSGTSYIAQANERRYAPYVGALTSIDTAQLANAYRRLYPLFQQAYRELGYPKSYFNDRLVDVIDDLLEAPEPAKAPAVIAPKAMFQYVDADLEALPAGQKILVRVGAANEKSIKDFLRAFRAQIAAPAAH